MEIVLSQIFDDVKQNSNRSDPGVLTRTKEVHSTFSINKNIRTINKYTQWFCGGASIPEQQEILETRYIEIFQSIKEYRVSNLQYRVSSILKNCDLFCLFSLKILHKFRILSENSLTIQKILEIHRKCLKKKVFSEAKISYRYCIEWKKTYRSRVSPMALFLVAD